ncbi:hypothetical protein BGW36DRAFT_409548 [Talaromyces proteolyticus]|uniref:Uncharacterized protein n=1 Tax=Talaromyces proteolyticus TaxID=1131652 RepID=A0AAD4PYD4_9EURO|nr:uncharacterized protein BGW36DRAFT_409548 [Talaromyces proteolyticus]KAH8693956.1 hypothetical protein BGW36DRAFT_409548 [Talaromyces proteolyticus]
MGKRPLVGDLFARSSGQPSPDADRPRPGPPPRRKSSVSSPRDDIGGRNRPKTRRAESTARNASSDNILAQDPGYDADVEVVRPYAIEEPDDDADQTSTSAPTQPATPKLLDTTEYWQRELVNSLRGLYCDSDSNDTFPLSRQKRGRKRKPDVSMSSSQNIRTIPDVRDQDIDLDAEGSISSPPKRPRRKSTKTGDDIKMEYAAAPNSRDLSPEPSSAILSHSGRESAPQINSPGDAMTDRMDLD